MELTHGKDSFLVPPLQRQSSHGQTAAHGTESPFRLQA